MASKTAHVFVVDDSADNRFLLEALLEDEGYIITTLAGGQEMLDIVAEVLPDLILLDIMMPGMSGYEATRKLRSMNTLPFIPILLVTAHERSNVVEGLDTGADDFIRKPFNADELLARVRALLRLKQSVDAEREITQQRDDFVSRLTHDLRTPLVAANRMLSLVTEDTFGTIPTDAKTAISQTILNNDNLLAMVNTLLEVYRHEAGRKEMVMAPFNLKRLLEEVVAELLPLAQEKQLTLKLDDWVDSQSDDRQYTLKGDRLEFRRVLVNLIGNALKFTDVGEVLVRFEKVMAETPYWQITVKDTGPGITVEDQAELFAWFRTGKHRRSGSGLGLHLAQRIVHAHGGRLSVSSEVGKGSSFTIQIPL
ncbi:hybrid sensor histidine kinase/response regulator [Oscillatoria sp. CS-180]|uniref:hybrid sensor histidine kinase/response regulator n=1 Tax=Oscillatoria sp. CS-180 TaxID=3021720 RepID=UPI00232ACA5C|nr:hybrid sensor histidine kinase/response regulator [Oscillatoria sp. CS-180]MDB9529443.1 hybrid sensor histidine kinase/response regulator [Oscillatoria sp. CS-180]